MELNRKKNKRDDVMTGCRSFGSTYHQCSQSRKMSIGVMVDSQPKTKSRTPMQDEFPNPKDVSKENSGEDRDKRTEVTSPIIYKQAEALELDTSPWVSTKSFNQKVPTSERIMVANRNCSLPATSGMHSRLNGVKGAAATYSVQFFSNQMSILQSSDGKQEKLQRVAYRRNVGKDTAEKLEEFSFAAAQEVLMPDKEDAVNKTENRGSETLRMKLQEILGTVSSPHKQFSDSQPRDMGTNSLMQEKRSDGKGDAVVRPIQNSDSIESDSENPDNVVRRPMTRSLTRKRAPIKLQPRRNGNVKSSGAKVELKKNEKIPFSSQEQKTSQKNIFSFEEGLSWRLHGAIKGGYSMPKGRKNEKKNSRIEPRRISFPEQDNEDDIQQASNKSKKSILAEKLSSIGNRRGAHSSSPPGTTEYVEPVNGVQKDYSDKFEDKKMADQLGHDKDSTGHYNMDQQDIVNLSLKNIVDTNHDSQSQASKLKIQVNGFSPDSIPKTNQEELVDRSPVGKAPNMEDITNFKSFSKPKLDYQEVKDDTEEPEESPDVKSVSVMEGKDMEDGFSKSSSEETDSDSAEYCSAIKGHRKRILLSPELDVAEKPIFVRHPCKKQCREGTEEFHGSPGPSELGQKDGLAGSVALFAMALERVKNKMMSTTSKKAAEILMSAGEGIHALLQSVESQIQTDVGKLTSLSKMRRKNIGAKFQEQQEQLKKAHERFKEEVIQHVQNCRGTLDGLEAYQIEFKGTLDKQKASHKKLLMQAEEAIETQLSDAQRRIRAVEKLAKGKMLQLKHVLAECLEEGILT